LDANLDATDKLEKQKRLKEREVKTKLKEERTALNLDQEEAESRHSSKLAAMVCERIHRRVSRVATLRDWH